MFFQKTFFKYPLPESECKGMRTCFWYFFWEEGVRCIELLGESRSAKLVAEEVLADEKVGSDWLLGRCCPKAAEMSVMSFSHLNCSCDCCSANLNCSCNCCSDNNFFISTTCWVHNCCTMWLVAVSIRLYAPAGLSGSSGASATASDTLYNCKDLVPLPWTSPDPL